MFNKILKWFEHIGTVRAAAELSRRGYHEAAKNLLTRETQ
jgi:hypothetical protein